MRGEDGDALAVLDQPAPEAEIGKVDQRQDAALRREFFSLIKN